MIPFAGQFGQPVKIKSTPEYQVNFFPPDILYTREIHAAYQFPAPEIQQVFRGFQFTGPGKCQFHATVFHNTQVTNPSFSIIKWQSVAGFRHQVTVSEDKMMQSQEHVTFRFGLPGHIFFRCMHQP